MGFRSAFLHVIRIRCTSNILHALVTSPVAQTAGHTDLVSFRTSRNAKLFNKSGPRYGKRKYLSINRMSIKAMETKCHWPRKQIAKIIAEWSEIMNRIRREKRETRRGEKHNAAEENMEKTAHVSVHTHTRARAQTSTICHRILTRW